MVAQLNYISWSLSTYVSNIWDLLELLFDPRPKSSNTDLLSRPDLILSSHTSRAGLQVLTLFWCKLVDHLSGWRFGNITYSSSCFLSFFLKKGFSLIVERPIRATSKCMPTQWCSNGFLQETVDSFCGEWRLDVSTNVFCVQLALCLEKLLCFW